MKIDPLKNNGYHVHFGAESQKDSVRPAAAACVFGAMVGPAEKAAFVQLTLVMDAKEKTKRHFNATAADYNNSGDGKFVQPMNESLVRELRKLKGGKLLDVGCGNGNLFGLLKEEYHFYGVDLSENMLIASGGANVYSFYKGRGEDDKANNIFNQCLTLTISVGVVITLFGFLFRLPLAVFFGANETLLPSTVAYLKWIAAFSLLQMLVCLLAVFIRNDDAPKLAMKPQFVELNQKALAAGMAAVA